MKAKIGRMQYFFMIPNLVYGKAIGVTSGIMVRQIGTDAWTSMLIGFIIGILVIVMMTYMGSRFPDKTIIQYSQELLGKWIGKAIGLILVLFFMIAFATSANTMILHFKDYFMPNTPYFLICLIYTLLCMYGVFLGFEVVVRFSLIGFLMTLLLNITMTLGTLQDFKFMNLQPIMDKGFFASLLTSGYAFSDMAIAILAIGIIYPMLNIKKRSIVLSFWAMVIATILVVTWPLFETGVMGADIMKKYVLVCMEQVRCAEFTKYLPRYELIMVNLFIFGIYVQSTAMFYCAKYSIKQIINIKKDWYIIVPLTIILIFITFFMAKDHNNFINFLTSPWSQICTALGIGLPLFLFIVALARGKLNK